MDKYYLLHENKWELLLFKKELDQCSCVSLGLGQVDQFEWIWWSPRVLISLFYPAISKPKGQHIRASVPRVSVGSGKGKRWWEEAVSLSNERGPDAEARSF